MRKRWFTNCLESYNRRKEQELIHNWSLLIVKAGGLFLICIILIKWIIG